MSGPAGHTEKSSTMRSTVGNRTFALAAMAAIAVGMPNVSASAQTLAERPQFPPPKPEVQAPAVETNLKTFDVRRPQQSAMGPAPGKSRAGHRRHLAGRP